MMVTVSSGSTAGADPDYPLAFILAGAVDGGGNLSCFSPGATEVSVQLAWRIRQSLPLRGQNHSGSVPVLVNLNVIHLITPA